MFPAGESITVVSLGATAGGFDENGNPVLAPDTSRVVEGVAVAPLSPKESLEAFGDMNVGGYTLYMPAGTGLSTDDRVTVRGEAGYQVQGDAGVVEWRNPFTGWVPGQVAVVRKAS